jgi:hypothetical protein
MEGAPIDGAPVEGGPIEDGEIVERLPAAPPTVSEEAPADRES